MTTPEERFWAHVNKTETCWLWTGSSNGAIGRQYGTFAPHHRNVRAHRYAYELLVGPIPEGLTLDHLCRVTLCVRPDHLEAVPMRENVLRGYGPTAMNARATHCKYGHELSGANLEMRHNGQWRVCLTCRRELGLAQWRKSHPPVRKSVRALSSTRSSETAGFASRQSRDGVSGATAVPTSREGARE